jgi:hypothetical protein
MLSTIIAVQQAINDCSVFVFTDKTGSYSETNPGGYGLVNAYRESLTFYVTRTGADGQSLRGILTFGDDNTATLCGSDWVDGTVGEDCGCHEVTLEKCYDDLGKDGCYNYLIEARQTIGGALVDAKTISVLHTCKTLKRIRKANLNLSTDCNRLSEDKLRRWARAFDFYRTVVEKSEVCCEEDTSLLEQIDLILRGIGY